MGDKLTAQHLIDILVQRQGLDREDADDFVREFFALIEEGLAKDNLVKIKGLGTFKLINVEDRESINVNTGERILIKGHNKISFLPDSGLKAIINKPFAHFETVVLNNEELLESTLQDEEPESDSTNDEETDFIDKVVANIETVGQESSTLIYTASDSPQETSIESIENDSEEKTPIINEPLVTQEEALPPATQSEALEHKPAIASEQSDYKKKSNSLNKTLFVVVLLTIIICGSLIFTTYFSDFFSSDEAQAYVDEEVNLAAEADNQNVNSTNAIEALASEQTQLTDSAATSLSTEVESVESASDPTQGISQTERLQTQQSSFSQIPVKPDSTHYDIVGTKALHTIVAGETLTRIAYKFYGTKDLYPYLIIHNRSIIKNPNVLPVGEIIVIPELRAKK